ncbi:conserved hypothetical protein [Neospora caninum Liverpool]|uniref:Uncharacterized protein n=1 Tax=Neospora caninum (strain Liverpool) TaxID=572307 RepID=F0VEW6_NEOCL|nr:conserved hypothetical protein [Neospora caninum Liverpool]CBZ52260.1 conserved hypothetical protein [Neospora caninum Liverpool]CEL66228.1 TPA: hypothetical protein BN1204_020470 [Neospora caninum Liverpool]|eukprot:XP_003882292.1 conserved hypothetical protein [Neospora caninum Liverpool]
MHASRGVSFLASSKDWGSLTAPIPPGARRFRRLRARRGDRRRAARDAATDAGPLVSRTPAGTPQTSGAGFMSVERQGREELRSTRGKRIQDAGEVDHAGVDVPSAETSRWRLFQTRETSSALRDGASVGSAARRSSVFPGEQNAFGSFSGSSERRGRCVIPSRHFASASSGLCCSSAFCRPASVASSRASPWLSSSCSGRLLAASPSSSSRLAAARVARPSLACSASRGYAQVGLQRGAHERQAHLKTDEGEALPPEPTAAPASLPPVYSPGLSLSPQDGPSFGATQGVERRQDGDWVGRDEAGHSPPNGQSPLSLSHSSPSVSPPSSAPSPSRSAGSACSSVAPQSDFSGTTLLQRLESIPWIGSLLQEVRALEANRRQFPSEENAEKLRLWWRSHAARLFISGVKTGCAGPPAVQLRMLRLALSFTPLAAAVPHPLDLPPAFSPPPELQARRSGLSSAAGETPRLSVEPEGLAEEPREPGCGGRDAFVRAARAAAATDAAGRSATEDLVVTQADADTFGPAFVVFSQLPSLPLEQRLWCLDQFAFFFVHNCLCATVRQADESAAARGEKRGWRGRGRAEDARDDRRKSKLKKEDIYSQVTCNFRVSSSGSLVVSDARLWEFLGKAVVLLGQEGYFDVAAHLTFSLLSLVYDIRAFPAQRPCTPAAQGRGAADTKTDTETETETETGQAAELAGSPREAGSLGEEGDRARQAENIAKRNSRWKLPKNLWLQMLATRHEAPLASSASLAASSGGLEASHGGDAESRDIPRIAFESQEIAAVDMVDELFLFLKREVAEAAPLLARALLLAEAGDDGRREGTHRGAAQRGPGAARSQFASQFMREEERSAKHRAFARILETAVVKRAAGMRAGNAVEEGGVGSVPGPRATLPGSSGGRPWQVIKKKNALDEQRKSVGGGWYFDKTDGTTGSLAKGAETEAPKELSADETPRAEPPGLPGTADAYAALLRVGGPRGVGEESARGESGADPQFSPPFGFSSLLWFLRLESIFYRTQDIDLSSIVYRLLTHLIDHEVPQFLFPPAASRAAPSAAPAAARVAPLSSLFAASPLPSFSLSRRGATTLAHAVGALKATRRYEHDLLRALCDALRPNLPLLSTPLACETMYNLGCLGYSDPAFAHALARHLASSGVLRHATVDSMMQLLIGFSRLEFRDDTLTDACIKGLLYSEGDRKKKVPATGQVDTPAEGAAVAKQTSGTPAAYLEEAFYQERQAGANASRRPDESLPLSVVGSERNNKVMQTSVDLLARTHRPQSLFYLLHSISKNFVRSLPLLASLLPALHRFATAVPSNVAVLAFHDLVKMGIWPGPFRKAILSTLTRDIERHSLIPLAASTILTWSLWGHFDVPLFLRMAHQFHRKAAAPVGGAVRRDGGEAAEGKDATQRGSDAREREREKKPAGKWEGARSVTSIKVSTQFWSSAYGLNLLALTPRDFIQHVNAVDRQIHLELLDIHRRQSVRQNAFLLADSLPPSGSPSSPSSTASVSDSGLASAPAFSPFSATRFPMRLFPRCRHSADARIRFSPWQTGSLEGLKAASLLEIPEENWIPKSSSFHAEVVASCPPFLRDRVINEQPAGPYEIDVALPAEAVDAWKRTQSSNGCDDEEEDRRRSPRKTKKCKGSQNKGLSQSGGR